MRDEGRSEASHLAGDPSECRGQVRSFHFGRLGEVRLSLLPEENKTQRTVWIIRPLTRTPLPPTNCAPPQKKLLDPAQGYPWPSPVDEVQRKKKCPGVSGSPRLTNSLATSHAQEAEEGLPTRSCLRPAVENGGGRLELWKVGRGRRQQPGEWKK